MRKARTDYQDFEPSDPAVRDGYVVAGRRQLLRFGTATPNRGAGDLAIGDPANFPELFTTSFGHEHPHYNRFVDFRLWTPEGYQALSRLRLERPGATFDEMLQIQPALSGHPMSSAQRGFCLQDDQPDPDAVFPRGQRKFTDCDTNQGISSGWIGNYLVRITGQWLDVTDVPNGDYVLEVETNPKRTLPESNYQNNSSAALVTLD